MGWKYVIVETTLEGGTRIEFPLIFPDKMIHSQVARAIRRLPPIRGLPARAVGAGMIEHLEVYGVGGKSETLGIKSRGETDKRLIEAYSYFHGIKG